MLELLNRGADVNALDVDLNTPLHLATKEVNSTGVLMLIEFGSSVTAINRENESPQSVPTYAKKDSCSDEICKKIYAIQGLL